MDCSAKHIGGSSPVTSIRDGTADAGLFNTIASNPNHSLYQILPSFSLNQYSVRKRWHPFQLLIINTTLLKSALSIGASFSLCNSLAPHFRMCWRSQSAALQVWCGRWAASCFILHTSCIMYSTFIIMSLVTILRVSVLHVIFLCT